MAPDLRVAVTVLVLLFGGGHAAAEDCVAVERFSRGTAGQFPPDWKPRKDAGREVYAVQAEDGLRFLHAVARDIGIQVGRELEWDLTTYPLLAWRWRPRQLPAGADERTDRNDSAVAVYAVFPHTRFSVKSLKYVWSEKVPEGTHLTSSRGLTQVRVVRSGSAGLNEWSEARADVLEDYRRWFEEEDVPRPSGIAVLTDADDTDSVAIGDYADFRICRR
jgi:hypothetical protein